jgi:NTP pyrophosphatase (non-canonical NTP hydrolase)
MAYRSDIYRAIDDERERQEGFVVVGKFKWTCADAETPDSKKLMVLLEEAGEVARAIREAEHGLRREHHDLKTELIQVAAVCVAWLEAL